MNFKRWKLGLGLATITGLCTGLVAWSVIATPIGWLAFIKLVVACAAKDLMLYLKDHPEDSISDTGFITKLPEDKS